MKTKNLLKKAFLLLALMGGATSAWATDYTVTATRVLSNSNKTCTWSAITANEGTAFENSKTALGEGLYFVATGKCTLNGGNSVNVKANGEMYIEVPSASSAGTVTFTNGANNRYMETESGGKVHMKGDSDNSDMKASLAFTSADIVDVSGTKYLKLTSKSDCKFATVAITLTSDETYELGEAEITAVKICGVAISASDLSTLKSTHSLTVAGSGVNGMPGTLDVTVANGATTVTRTISGTTANYAFTVNEIDYTVSITNVNESHSAVGSVVYFSKNGVEAEGTETSSLTANGITFSYPTKGLSYGSATVTLGSDVYQAIKLSTGEAVSVTFPEGKVATKVVVYGWSTDGLTGYLSSLKESSTSNKTVSSVGSNKFYATNTASDVYPTVYEYDLANWESAYFQGSGSQPFVVMDFVLVDAPIVTLPTGSKTGYSCSGDASTYSRSGHPFNSQSVYTISNGGTITLKVPVTTQISKIQVLGTSDDNSNTSTITITGTNNEKVSGSFVNRNSTSLSQLEFTPTTQTTTYTINSANKASVVQIAVYGTENVATISSYGYATFSSTSPVDCAHLPSGLKAYKATACDGTTVTMVEVTGEVAANTGLVLKGAAGTYNIPVAESGTTPDGNLLFAINGSYETVGTGTGGTNYVLSVQSGNVVWAPISGTAAPVKAGQAALFVPDSNSARALRMVFPGGEITGVANVEAAETVQKDGKFFKDGKLFIFKNGKKFNANGQQVK